MTTPKPPLRIAVMLDEVQLSDILGIDILGNLSQQYLSSVLPLMPELSVYSSVAAPMEFFFLSSSLTPTRMTPGIHYMPNTTYDECPRDLDIVLTGGPLPSHRPEPATRFIREAWPRTKVWLTTCVGSIWLGDAGILDGLKATTNRGFLPAAREMLPKVEWLDQRWVVEEKVFEGEGKGELWTAGGAGAGEFLSPFLCSGWDWGSMG